MLSKYNKKLCVSGMACIFFVLCMVNCRAALAGEINGNEEGVIRAAGSTFYYGGEAYVARKEYIAQLKEELSADDVDLTAKQADELITEMYGNIRQGIEEGYLVKAESGHATAQEGDSQGEQTENTETAEGTQGTDIKSPGQGDKASEEEGKGEKKNPDKGKEGQDGSPDTNNPVTGDQNMNITETGQDSAGTGEAGTGQDEGSTGEGNRETGADSLDEDNVFDRDIARMKETMQEAMKGNSTTGTVVAAAATAGAVTAHGNGSVLENVVIMVLGCITFFTGYLLVGKYKKQRQEAKKGKLS